MTCRRPQSVTALLLLAALVPGAVLATPCDFEPTPPQQFISGPFKPPPTIVRRVRGANAETPFTIEAHSSSPLTLLWQRIVPSIAVDLQEQLIVSSSRDNGATFEPYCETPWTSADKLNSFVQLSLHSDAPVLWRAEVYEQDRTPNMTVLDEERPTITLVGALDGAEKITPTPIPFFDQIRDKAPETPAPCAVTEEAATSDAILVTEGKIPKGGLRIDGTLYAVSGTTLRLKLSGDFSGSLVKIQMSAKPIGYGLEPRPVCTIDVKAESLREGQWITATAPWEMISENRWRITLVSGPNSPAVHYAVFRERPPSMARKAVGTHGTDAYSCTGPAVDKPSPVDPIRAQTFQGAYALTIHTNLKERGITGEPYRKVVEAILTSIDGWRVICQSCAPYQFSIVDIDQQVYAAGGMLHGTSLGDFRATFIVDYPWSWRFWPQKSTGLFSSALSFIPVSSSERQRHRFCVQKSEDEYGFSAAESPLCRPSPPSSDREMIINFDWRPDGLTCDSDEDVVACWNGTDLIELNLKDYSFYIGDTGDTLVGTAVNGADLIRVFTHEVGHWLGLGHMVGGGNVMSPNLREAQCINDSNVRMINSVARGEVERVHQAESLRYE